jgi:hypothetical protein
VRDHYKRSVASHPDFKTLDPEEQGRVLKAIDGDGGFSIQMAAVIIAAAQRERLGRSILEPTYDESLDEALKGAKSAEHYLDVPIKDRPREPFQDEIPGHLDKPLRALLGFIDDALPEYPQYKFWQSRASQSLEDRLRGVLALSSKLPERPVDANAALNLSGYIRTYEDLDRRLPTRLPPLRSWQPDAQEKQLTTDAEAALKHGLTQSQWGAPDRAVQTVLIHVLAGVKQGVPRAFRPDAIPPIIASIKQKCYEIMSRSLYHLPSKNGLIPLDPEAIGETILASAVISPGMEQVADDFPSLFAVVSGLASVPNSALGRYRTFIQNEVRRELTPGLLLQFVTTGSFSLIHLAKVDEMILQAAADAAGAHPDIVSHIIRDAVGASRQPLLAALMVRSANMDIQDFKKAQDQVRTKLAAEVQKQMQPKPRPAPPITPEEPDEIHQVHRDGVSALVVPEHMAFIDPDPEDPESQTPHAVAASGPAPVPQESPNSPTVKPEAPVDKPVDTVDNSISTYLKANPISIKSVKAIGLLSDFKKHLEVLSKGGATLKETMAALISGKLLPPKSDYNDILDALDHRGPARPPPTEDAGTSSPADPSASSPEKTPEETAPETPKAADGKAPDFEVKVVEVDPAALIPRKTASEIEPSRIRGVQQRFPEGKGYPAVTAWEGKDGLHIIDGHHRTMVGKGRGDTVKVVVVSEKDFKAMEAAGIDNIEISRRMLAKAGETDAMEHLDKQYAKKNVAGEAKP